MAVIKQNQRELDKGLFRGEDVISVIEFETHFADGPGFNEEVAVSEARRECLPVRLKSGLQGTRKIDSLTVGDVASLHNSEIAAHTFKPCQKLKVRERQFIADHVRSATNNQTCFLIPD